MLNHEVTKSLVRERQQQLAHHGVMSRLARRARRSRRQDADETEHLYATIILPPPRHYERTVAAEGQVASTRHPAAA